MVAKAARVKKIPFTCEITDPLGKTKLIKNIFNPSSGLVHMYVCIYIYIYMYEYINIYVVPKLHIRHWGHDSN